MGKDKTILDKKLRPLNDVYSDRYIERDYSRMETGTQEKQQINTETETYKWVIDTETQRDQI